MVGVGFEARGLRAQMILPTELASHWALDVAPHTTWYYVTGEMKFHFTLPFQSISIEQGYTISQVTLKLNLFSIKVKLFLNGPPPASFLPF